jgi:phage baseplate assembly protein gpV
MQKLACAFLAVSILVLARPGTAFGVQKTFTGAVSQDWFEGGNWSPSGVPTATDGVVLGTGQLALESAATVATFNQTGGTLKGNGTLTVSGLLTWTDGAMSGAGVTNANGGLSLSGAARRTCSAR